MGIKVKGVRELFFRETEKLPVDQANGACSILSKGQSTVESPAGPPDVVAGTA
jgi:hypothetical protein